jgi:hypothetical protein
LTFADAITNRLQALTINLQDQMMTLDSYMDGPAAFDLGSFRYIQREAERSCDQAIHTLGQLHQSMLQAGLKRYQLSPQDDRTQLTSMRGTSPAREPDSRLTPTTNAADVGVGLQSPISPIEELPGSGIDIPAVTKSSRISGPSYYDVNIPTGTSYGSYKGELAQELPPPPPPSAWQESIPVISPRSEEKSPQKTVGRRPVPLGATLCNSATLNKANLKSLEELIKEEVLHAENGENRDSEQTGGETATPGLIKRDEIVRQVGINERLLEKRRQSRMAFQKDFEQLINRSTSSASNQESIVASPLAFSAGPSEVSYENITVNLTRTRSREIASAASSERIDPRYSTATIDSHGSIASTSPQINLTSLQRQDSEPLIFGPPETPPLSEGRQSGNAEWGMLVSTPKTPDFGSGVEDGIQVVGQLVSDPGLMLAAEHNQAGPSTPATSIKTTEYPITQDASFYKYGGFCEGAKMFNQNLPQALKFIKKPAVSRIVNLEYSMLTSAGYWIYSHHVDALCQMCLRDFLGPL